MTSAVRWFVLPLAASLVLLAASGCDGSNNKGKVEGKWKLVAVSDTAAAKSPDTFLVFGEDGSVKLECPSPDSASGLNGKSPGWKYKLLAGDDADFYDLPADATARFGYFPANHGVSRVTIRIVLTMNGKYEDRNMTLTDSTGQTLKMTWVR